MDLTSIKTIRYLCKQFNIRPSKRLGQNFLINKSILDKIIKAGELNKKDTVLEIGPGFGVLTQELVKYVGKVVAVEKDKKLVKHIKQVKQVKKIKNLKIINDDILKVETRHCLVSTNMDYKIISNLPYQITSPILWKFLHQPPRSKRATGSFGTPPLRKGGNMKPSLMVLMMQKEVAERIVAKPGQMSILSVMCQFYAECEIVMNVPRGNFYPEPEVDSAVVKFKIRPYGWLQSPDWSHVVKAQQVGSSQGTGANMAREKEFLTIVKIGFSSKRKMLKNNLSKGLKIPQEKVIKVLNKAGLDEKVRAQELSVNDWIKVLCNL